MSGSTDSYKVSTKHSDTGRYDRWRIRWELPPDPITGERRRGSKRGFARKSDAEQALHEILNDVNHGTYVAPSNQTVAAYLTQWLGTIRVKPTTHDNYRVAAEVHTIPRLGGVKLSALTAHQVDQLYRDLEAAGKRAGQCRTAGVTCRDHACRPSNHRGLAAKSVRHVHTMLRKALQDAVDRQDLAVNVADAATPPTQKQARSRRSRDEVWTPEQARRFLAATADDRDAPMWELFATTGMRRAEVVGLRWRDLDLNAGRLTVAHTITEVSGGLVEQDDGKTDAAERTFRLDAVTVEALRRWRAAQLEERLALGPAWTDAGLVFTREDGTAHRPKRLSSHFTTVCKRVGVPPVGLHGVRHSYATISLRAGVSPEVVSKRLGHSSVAITLSIYAHVFEQDDAAAAEVAATAVRGVSVLGSA